MASRPSVVWVFMISNSSGASLAGLSRMRSGLPSFAIVVQRGGLEDRLDGVFREFVAKARVVLQLAGQRFHIVLRAADMVAGLVVPRFGQRCHGADGGVL